ncbi:piggyBac transposable element-derived protein 3-like [Perca flavescens]|uniref:piggyBac transposable element-derived protein 3-like n=1 Tax=Perca flavescens TaxID=8167 RepID=UPI00106DEE02|nr:piggyBac transposable element-derived protein 3-like [Perca flavescens]
MGHVIRSCDFMPTFQTFVSKSKLAAYVDKDTGHEGISVSSFYSTRKREVKSVVLPPDGSSDSEEGSNEEVEEDELYRPTEGQCEDDSSSSDNLNGSSSHEAEEGAKQNKQANQNKRGKMFSWRKTEFEHQSTATQSCFTAPDELSTPLMYFSKFFDKDIFEVIAQQTNLYSCQLIGCSINTNVSEIKAFIGMKRIMGIVKMPAMENYWATDTRYEKVADVMPLKRYKCLSRMLHFQDNMSSESSEDVLDHMRSKCMELESENQFSIDEMMVPYKGKKKAGSLRQYLPSKPKNGIGTHLKDSMGLRSSGTIRKNRLMGCRVEEDRDLLRRGRGSFDFRVDNDAKLAVVKWADNKTDTLVSSCASVNPVGQVRRYSKEEKRKISVPCPKIVSEYNTHMGGVDLADMMIALYRTPAKSHRWYMGIYWQIVDIAVNNAWLLHRHDAAALGQKHQCLKDFRLDAARGLIYLEKQKRGRPSKGNEDNTPQKVIKQPKVPRPVDDMRYDRIDHFPILSVKGRCRMCQDGQTSIMCQKCKIEDTCFSMTLFREGYSEGTDPTQGRPNAKICTQVLGAGNTATTTSLVMLLQFLLWGGVYTPGAAFYKTSLIDRLHNHSIKFSVRGYQ